MPLPFTTTNGRSAVRKNGRPAGDPTSRPRRAPRRSSELTTGSFAAAGWAVRRPASGRRGLVRRPASGGAGLAVRRPASGRVASRADGLGSLAGGRGGSRGGRPTSERGSLARRQAGELTMPFF